MKFWRALVFNAETQMEQSFVLQAPYGEERILEVLAEVHPEYETIKLEQIDRPDWITSAWGDD